MGKNEDEDFKLSVKTWVPSLTAELPQTDKFLSCNKLLWYLSELLQQDLWFAAEYGPT